MFLVVKNSHPIPHQQALPSSEQTRKQQSYQEQQRANHSKTSTKSEYVVGYRCQDCLSSAVMLNTPCRTCACLKYKPVYAKSANEEVQSQPMRDASSLNGVGFVGGIVKFVGDMFVPSSTSFQHDVDRGRVRQDQTYADAARAYSSPKVLGSNFAYDYNKTH